MKDLVFVALLGMAAMAIADGPGTRIRATPAPPQPAGPIDRDLQRCESMAGEQKERCLRALRSAENSPSRAPHQGPSPGRPGPEATGGGSNAGTGATSGTSGASSAVGGAR